MFFSGVKSAFYKYAEWVLYVFIALFPFIIYQGYLFYGTATRSVNLIVVSELLILGFGIALISSKNRLIVAKSPITLALLLFLITLFISAIQGVDFLASFWSKATRTAGLFYFLHLGFFYLFLFMLFIKEGKFLNFLKVFLISAGIFSIASLLSKDGFGIIFSSKPWVGFTFGNSTFAGMYVYTAFLLSIYYVVSQPTDRRRWWKNLLPLIFVINPYIINRDMWLGKVDVFHHPLAILGEARATAYTVVFSVLALLGIYVIAKIKSSAVRRKILWSSIVIGVVVAAVAVRSFLSIGGYLREAYLTQATLARPIVWELSEKSIRDRPLLGWGMDNFDRAFETHYDNRLLEEESGAEPWFDRAHNIFIDQTVDTGYLGLLVYLLVYAAIIGSMVCVLLQSKSRADQSLAAIVLVYFVGHIMELQTAFDTTISYVPLTIMTAAAAAVFHKNYSILRKGKSEWQFPKGLQYTLGIFLIGMCGYFFFAGTIPIIRAQAANGAARTAGTPEKRLALYPALFGSPVDQATFLWRTSTDLQRGIAVKPSILQNQKFRQGFIKELDFYVQEYNKYFSTHKHGYRARINLAEIYIYQRLFEINHLDEAQKTLDQAIEKVPQAPQAYWMKAVTYLYMHKFDDARLWAKKAYELNPRIKESKRVVEYIDRSIRTFPEIDLYSFSQI